MFLCYGNVALSLKHTFLRLLLFQIKKLWKRRKGVKYFLIKEREIYLTSFKMSDF